MTHVLAVFALICAQAPNPQTETPALLDVGSQLVYRGSMARTDEDGTPVEPEKKFDLVVLISRFEPSGAELYWIVSESGRGGWPWIERTGRVRLGGAPAQPANRRGRVGNPTKNSRLGICDHTRTDEDFPAGFEAGRLEWGIRTACGRYQQEGGE